MASAVNSRSASIGTPVAAGADTCEFMRGPVSSSLGCSGVYCLCARQKNKKASRNSKSRATFSESGP